MHGYQLGSKQRIIACLLAFAAIALVVARGVSLSHHQGWQTIGLAAALVTDPPALVEIDMHSLIIVQTDQQVIALDRRDSHAHKCFVRWQAERRELADPCLGTRYHPDGTYIAGPAPRDLNRYPLHISDGQLSINLAQPVRGSVRNKPPTVAERLQRWFMSVTQ